MTSRLRFRNIDADPSEPVETWPDEGVQAALERGGISDYRRLIAAVRADPRGEVAQRIERVLSHTRPYGAAPLLEQAIARHRARADVADRAEVARLLGEQLQRSGLTRAQFAARLGTSTSRLSTYLGGSVTPSAALLIRAERIAAR